jgi:predicted nucleic acid-binding Zn ribbon protein
MLCENCKKETKNKKFCSSSCSAIWNNKLFPKRKPEHVCKNCKTKINSLRRFCSPECKSIFIKEKHKTKKCSLCKKIFPRTTEHFYLKGKAKGFQSYCKKCYTIKTVERQKETKKRNVNYLGGKCKICNYNRSMRSLTFHHFDPKKKEYSLSSSRIFNFEKCKKEMDKCLLVCANCHGEIHDGLFPQYLANN